MRRPTTRTVQSPGRTCTRRRPSGSSRAGNEDSIRSGTKPSATGRPTTISREAPLTLRASSVVISVELGARRILMVGDTEAVAEQDLLQACAECLDADWVPSNVSEQLGVRAAQGLALYLSDEAAELLLAGVERTTNEAVQEACYQGLERIRRYQDERRTLAQRRAGAAQREESIAKLARLLADDDPLVVAAAARGLATLDAVEQLPALVELLRHADARVKAAAQEALDVLNRRDDGTDG